MATAAHVATPSSFVPSSARRRAPHKRLLNTASATTSNSSANNDDVGENGRGHQQREQDQDQEQHWRRRRSGVGVSRRTLLASTAGVAGSSLVSFPGEGGMGVGKGSRCRCGGGCAWAMAPLINVPAEKREAFDPQRNAQQDTLFAKGMNSGMTGYEQAIASRKQELFSAVFAQLAASGVTEATVVEVGMGTFPNANYYFDPAVAGTANRGYALDLVGIDPNDAMETYARDNLAKAIGGVGRARGGGESESSPSTSTSTSLRIAHGVAEALPLATNSADAVVCTLTLCSVFDPDAAVAEIKRVLKPGAPFLFVEHVLSEDDPGLAQQQLRFNSLQIAMADGCHLDRKTLDVVKAAGFKSVTAERFTLPGFGLISSQVAGIAVA